MKPRRVFDQKLNQFQNPKTEWNCKNLSQLFTLILLTLTKIFLLLFSVVDSQRIVIFSPINLRSNFFRDLSYFVSVSPLCVHFYFACLGKSLRNIYRYCSEDENYIYCINYGGGRWWILGAYTIFQISTYLSIHNSTLMDVRSLQAGVQGFHI